MQQALRQRRSTSQNAACKMAIEHIHNFPQAFHVNELSVGVRRSVHKLKVQGSIPLKKKIFSFYFLFSIFVFRHASFYPFPITQRTEYLIREGQCNVPHSLVAVS
jgi:hypothetical protein